MTHAVFADTGPLLAAVDPDDQFHARAQSELLRLSTERISVLITSSTMIEAYTLILRRLSIAAAHRWLTQV